MPLRLFSFISTILLLYFVDQWRGSLRGRAERAVIISHWGVLWSAFTRGYCRQCVCFLCPCQDLLLIHDVLVAAHAVRIAAGRPLRVRVVINAHNGEALLDGQVIWEFHRKGFLVESVELLVVCLGEALACRFSSYQVHSLQLAKEENWDKEEGRNQWHYYTGGAAILVPRVLITILILFHDIVNEFELEVWLKV